MLMTKFVPCGNTKFSTPGKQSSDRSIKLHANGKEAFSDSAQLTHSNVAQVDFSLHFSEKALRIALIALSEAIWAGVNFFYLLPARIAVAFPL